MKFNIFLQVLLSIFLDKEKTLLMKFKNDLFMIDTTCVRFLIE